MHSLDDVVAAAEEAGALVARVVVDQAAQGRFRTGPALTAVKGPPDKLGQSTTTWQAGESYPCASYPAGKRVLEVAQLKGVRVSREVYLERLNLDPQKNRVRVDGVEYVITLVNDWEHDFSLLGVVSV